MRASGIFFCIRIGDFCIVPISVSRRCGHDYAVFRGENRLFSLLWAIPKSRKDYASFSLPRRLKPAAPWARH